MTSNCSTCNTQDIIVSLVAKGKIQMLTFKNQKGQGLVEYALILVLVAIVVIVILSLLGPAVGNVFSQIYRAI